MTVKAPVAGQKKLVMPAHPKGTRVKVLSADYEQIINEKGEVVRRPLSDTPVRVSFVVCQDVRLNGQCGFKGRVYALICLQSKW